MKNRLDKGQYGYREQNRRMRLVIVMVLILAILAQLGARLLTTNQAAKNILTVMAILTVLPMANMASPLLASWRYKTPPEAFHQKMTGYEGQFLVLYDLIVTTKEQILPFDAVVVHPVGIYTYCPFPSSGKNTAKKVEKAEKAINELLTAGRCPLSLRILTEERSFFKRLDSLKPADSYEDDGSVEYAVSQIKTLSM